MIYRVKQFFQGLFANISKEDRAFINKYLNQDEQVLFFKLRLNEQYHSLKVAYGCCGCEPNNRSLIRAALLHDVGKLGSNLNLINKSLVVLLTKFHLEEGKLPSFLKKAVYFKKHHPELGYKMLLSYEIDTHELELIRQHHEPHKETDQEMRILQYYDNKY